MSDPLQAALDAWSALEQHVDEQAAAVGDERRAGELQPLPEAEAGALDVPPGP